MSYETVLENEGAYFDTSMWVALILGNVSHNKHWEFAQDKFTELDNGAFHVHVSDLVLMEATWAIKKRTAESKKKNVQTSQQDLETEIDNKVKMFYREIEKAQNAGKVTVENPQYSLDQFLQKTHSVSIRPQKDTLVYRNKEKEYRYADTGFVDFQHAIIATDLKCNHLYSLDKGFERMKSMREFRTLAIVTP